MAEIGGEPRGGPQRGRREGARPSAKGTKPSLDDDPTQMPRDEDLGGRPTKTRAREGKNKKKREKKGWRIRHDLAGRITKGDKKPVDSHVSCAHFCGRGASSARIPSVSIIMAFLTASISLWLPPPRPESNIRKRLPLIDCYH